MMFGTNYNNETFLNFLNSMPDELFPGCNLPEKQIEDRFKTVMEEKKITASLSIQQK